MRILRAAAVLAVVLGVVAAGSLLAPKAQGQPRVWVGPGLTLDGASQIGVSVRDVESADVSREKLAGAAGAVIDEVRSDGPAAKAGLKVGDVVLEFDGEQVRGARHLTRLVRETPEGRTVKAVVVRDGKRLDVTITPERRDGPPYVFDAGRLRESLRPLERLGRDLKFDFNIDPDIELRLGDAWSGRWRLGVSVQELTPQLAEYFGTKDGVLVASVVENSAAAKAGLRAGDVITAVNERPVTRASDLARELRVARSGEVTIAIVRDRKPMTLKATIENVADTRDRIRNRIRERVRSRIQAVREV